MVRVGIVGSGFGLYGHLPAFNSIPGCKVTAICGKKTKRLLDYCKGIGLKKIYSDWQEMLDREKLDALSLAVPPGVQYQIAKVAINKGLHVFAEKPLAVTYKQAKELLNLAQKKKIKHAIDFEFQEIPEWKKVKELLAKKTYGRLKQIYLNWDVLSYAIKNKITSWKTDAAQGGGALSLYFSHDLYYLEYFAGRISNIKSLMTAETGVDLLLKFANKITGYAHFSCNSLGLNRHQLIFACEKGTIILENQGKKWVSGFTIKVYTEEGVKQIKPHVAPSQARSYVRGEDERVKFVRKMAAKFIKAIAENKKVAPSFKEGARVQELIEKIRKSAI